MNAGVVVNTARADGRDPDDRPVRSPNDTTSTPTTRPQPSLSIEKSVDGIDDVNESTITDAGDIINYSFVVTNVGNVPVHDIEVVDPKVSAAPRVKS